MKLSRGGRRDHVAVHVLTVKPRAMHATNRRSFIKTAVTGGGPRVLENDINYEWADCGVVIDGETALIHCFRAPIVALR